MIKTLIKKYGNEITHSAFFETQELATAWVNHNKLTGTFGKPDRWLTEAQAIDEDKDLADAIDIAEMINPFPGNGEPATYMIYKYPAEFSVEYVDITTEVAAQAVKARGLGSQNAGAEIIAAVWALNEVKLEAGSLTAQQFQAILADQSLALVERLLWNGSLRSAKSLIQAYSGDLFSAEEKTLIVALIDEKIEQIHGG
jgi:hypothetical protein